MECETQTYEMELRSSSKISTGTVYKSRPTRDHGKGKALIMLFRINKNYRMDFFKS